MRTKLTARSTGWRSIQCIVLSNLRTTRVWRRATNSQGFEAERRCPSLVLFFLIFLIFFINCLPRTIYFILEIILDELSNLFRVLIENSIELFSVPLSFFERAIDIHPPRLVHHDTKSLIFLIGNKYKKN